MSHTSHDSIVLYSNTDKQLNVSIHTDNYPTETTWNLCANEQVNYGGPFYADLNVYGAYACVESDKQYEFRIEDSWGDAVHMVMGYYVLTLNGEFLQSGGAFCSSNSALFGNCDVSTPTPSPPTHIFYKGAFSPHLYKGTFLYFDKCTNSGPILPPYKRAYNSCTPGCPNKKLDFIIETDSYPSETSYTLWELCDLSGKPIVSSGPFTSEPVH